jgi:hypothetical protein
VRRKFFHATDDCHDVALRLQGLNLVLECLCLTEPTREVSRGFTEIMREWRRLFAKPTDKFCQLGLYFFIKKIQDEEA